jgi:hypothetical protein
MVPPVNNNNNQVQRKTLTTVSYSKKTDQNQVTATKLVPVQPNQADSVVISANKVEQKMNWSLRGMWDTVRNTVSEWTEGVVGFAKGTYAALTPEEKKEIKKETKEAVKALNSKKISEGEKNKIANDLTEKYVAKGILTSEQVANIKRMSLHEKQRVLAGLNQMMEKSDSPRALLSTRKNIRLVHATLTVVENKNGEIQALKIDALVISDKKVKEFTKIVSVKKDAPDITEKELNDVGSDVGVLAEVHAMDKQDITEVKAPNELVKSIGQSTEELSALASDVIKIAEAKGYKLDNFAQLASIAGIVSGEGTETEVVTVTDIGQFNALIKVQKALSNLFTEVSNMLMENREKNRKLDEASAKITLENKRDELKQIEREFIKTLQEKQSQNIKLENKLHAEITALSYLLQNPGQITQKLVDDIINEVKKIKLQIR